MCSSVCGYSGSVQFTRRQRSMRRVRASSFSARLKDCFLKTACATGPGKLQASSLGSGARKTSSGEPNSRSRRAESREASPGVSASASQEREASSSIARRAYARNNLVVKCQMRNLEAKRRPEVVFDLDMGSGRGPHHRNLCLHSRRLDLRLAHPEGDNRKYERNTGKRKSAHHTYRIAFRDLVGFRRVVSLLSFED